MPQIYIMDNIYIINTNLGYWFSILSIVNLINNLYNNIITLLILD
jgi:uncharacterized membrane protein